MYHFMAQDFNVSDGINRTKWFEEFLTHRSQIRLSLLTAGLSANSLKHSE